MDKMLRTVVVVRAFKSKLLSFWAVTALAVFCSTTPICAKDQVPFKGQFTPAILSSSPADQTHMRFELELEAKATHLGGLSGSAFFVLDVTTFTYVGESIWTAPNGDLVFFTFAGSFVPSSTPGILENEQVFEVVGGTGRFENATGSGVAAGQVDEATLAPLAPAPFVGSISSPGSLKK